MRNFGQVDLPDDSLPSSGEGEVPNPHGRYGIAGGMLGFLLGTMAGSAASMSDGKTRKPIVPNLVVFFGPGLVLGTIGYYLGKGMG